ncbi:MAG: hypothetical protein RRC07_09300 [Anaerolineae bacterium]|nr:hypothetical protein [Anaerolineae bacterium]
MADHETIDVTVKDGDDVALKRAITLEGDAVGLLRQSLRDRNISLQPNTVPAAGDLFLWYIIERSTLELSFNRYKQFIDAVMCGDEQAVDGLNRASTIRDRISYLGRRRALPYTDMDGYRLLKVATEAFVTVNCGVLSPERGSDVDFDAILAQGGATSDDLAGLWRDYLKSVNGDDDVTLPYLMLVRDKLDSDALLDIRLDGDGHEAEERLRLCKGVLLEKLAQPCFLELIWCYWQEQGMLVQSLNAISRRFQNVRGPAERDPLAAVEIDPLRPLNNLLWGYVQDEPHRLSVVRRAYEYDHHYGLALEGKAIPALRPADSRSRFLETFHILLRVTSAYYRQRDDVTIRADAFPVLNALKDLHLVLSEGAHGQFGDMPTTARIEMLMQQWLLARPEFREFLPTRIMVAYPEPWMDRVAAMRKLQGWGDTNITHFRDLAVFGEQLLLSVRYGAWSTVDRADQAAVWANFWRSQVQGYIHAYEAVTGIDLSAPATMDQDRSALAVQPSVLIQRRLTNGDRARPRLSRDGDAPASAPQGLRKRLAARRAAGD